MHLVTLSEPCPYPFVAPTQVLPQGEPILCTSDVVKQLCFVDSQMKVSPCLATSLENLDDLKEDHLHLVVEGNLIDYIELLDQLETKQLLRVLSLYAPDTDALFLNQMLGKTLFQALPQKMSQLPNLYQYRPPGIYNQELLNHCRIFLKRSVFASSKIATDRQLPLKNNFRLSLALQAYKDPQWLSKPLIRQLISHLNEHERLILWDHREFHFIYPDHLAHQFDASVNFDLKEAIELLQSSDLYIGPYNHWMCLALIFKLPILALSCDLRARELLRCHPLAATLPDLHQTPSCLSRCYHCGDLNSKEGCKPFCKPLESLSLEQISDYLFFFLETSQWPPAP